MSGARRGRPVERFTIARVRLVGFHNFVDDTLAVPDGGHLFLLGDNGSGKTTVLDAVQYALTAGLGLELNAAARLGGRKDEGRTLQGVVLRYNADRGPMNDAGVAYAAVELVPDDGGVPLVVGVGTEATSMDARVTRWGFVVRNHLEAVPLVRADRVVVGKDELRERLGREQVHLRIEDFRRVVAERLFGGPALYDEVCRFWSMAKAYREIVAGARDFDALFARLLPAPDAQVFADILGRLREIDGLDVSLRELEAQRAYVAAIVELEDELGRQREAEARYTWLLAHRRLDELEAAHAAAGVEAARLTDALAAAEAARQVADGAGRVAETELRAALDDDAVRILGALGEAEARLQQARAQAAVAEQAAARAQAEAEAAAVAATRATAAFGDELGGAATRLEVAALRVAHPELAGWARRRTAAAAALAGGALEAVLDSAPAALAELAALGLSAARRRRDQAVSAERDAERAVAQRAAERATLDAQPDEVPDLAAWADLAARLAPVTPRPRALYEVLEPRPGADARRLAAVEALAGEAGLGLLLPDAEVRDAVVRLAREVAPDVHVYMHAGTAAGPALPGWIDDLFTDGAPGARAALATWLAQADHLGAVPPPDDGQGGALAFRGTWRGPAPARPRLLGAAARAAALAARRAAAQAAEQAARAAAAAAVRALAAADRDVALHEQLTTALRELDGPAVVRAHAAALGAQSAAQGSAARARLEAERAQGAARAAGAAGDVHAALVARAGGRDLDEVGRLVARLRARVDETRRLVSASEQRLGLLGGERERALRVAAALGDELTGARRVRTEAAARVRALVAPAAGLASDDDVARYVREVRRGDQFRSTAHVEDARREAARLAERAAVELGGDGSRGVRSPVFAPRFAFAWDAASERVVGRHGERASHPLATVERELAAQREVVNDKTRELMDTLVMGSLARHLQEQVERLHRMVREINRLLAGIAFGGSVYRFEVSARADRREAVELVKRVALVDEDSRRRFRAWIDEKLPDLRAAGDAAEVPEVLDYRRWFDFRLRVASASGDVELTAERRRLGSGGEQGVPNYLLVLALGKLMFDNADARVRPMLFDEAFYGIDAGRRDQLLRFATELGLQLFVASPDQDGVTPAVRHATTLFVVKDASCDVHVAPYHYWNHAAAAQVALFAPEAGEGARIDPATDAICRVGEPAADAEPHGPG